MRSLLILLLLAGLVRAEFPQIYNSEDEKDASPLAPQEAAASFQVPEGFQVEVVAAEPDVQNPIGMAWDAQGRLWIAENYTYAEHEQRFDRSLRDRVLYFEDTDGDGRPDKRNVFLDNVQLLTSVEVGLGGVWLMCPPNLLFVPDADHDGTPDGPAEVVLDGFEVAQDNYHNFANGLRFGPDGWLYGRCGGSCPGLIGVPGTLEERRQPLNGGIWRYHPRTKHVEVLTSGTTNPWGHDWNELGELFFVNTVNGHLWHGIPGAHFVRPFTLDPNPKVYELIDQHADHWHFDTGGAWHESRDGVANEYGGGHAHIGAMIYQGNNWPEEYRGRLFTVNMHGQRVNQEVLIREGSGYVGKHGKDILLSGDPFFRGMDLSAGPDGSVYLIDWSDTGECHESTGVHRTSGRIFRISHGSVNTWQPPPQGDTYYLNALVQRLENNWVARQSRLVLAEKAQAGEDLTGLRELLVELVREAEPQPSLTTAAQHTRNRLRFLWALHAAEGVDPTQLTKLLDDGDEPIRVWAIRLLTEQWPLDGILGPVPFDEAKQERVRQEAEALLPKLVEMARHDESGLVRLTLASTIQRLPVDLRPKLAAALVQRGEDAHDHNLPLLVWYGLIPVADQHPDLLIDVAASCRWPTTRKLIARRLTEDIESNPGPLNALLIKTQSFDAEHAEDILAGMAEALRGWAKAPKPKAWGALQTTLAETDDQKLAQQIRELGAVFGDGRALDQLRKIALDSEAEVTARQAALKSLIEAKPDDLRKLCEQLMRTSHVNVVAARGLARFDDPAAAQLIVDSYRSYREPQRPELIAILVSRPSFARVLFEALEQGRIRKSNVTAIHVRQLRTLGDEELLARVNEVWGEVRESSEEKQKAMAYWKKRLNEETLAAADPSQGRVVFEGLCAKCHRLYGEGSTIGPDLTGGNRGNLDYLLENIIDPSAVVSADYRMTVLQLEDGRVMSGIVVEETERTLTLQTPNEQVVVSQEAIEARKKTGLSPMPDLQLGAQANQPGALLSDAQFRDLIGYLQKPAQVPLPIQ